MKKTTLTIGIPAFNEAKNIGNLLNDILSQKQTNYSLKKVIISSDGSTDDTVKIVNSLKINKINMFANHDRQGISRGINQIIKNTNSEVLILLDADIKIVDPGFIQKLIEPIISNNIDLTSCVQKELEPNNFYSRALWLSMQIKNNVFTNFNNANNMYTCHGPVRALSKKLYTKIRIPKECTNDMYTYLYCIYHGLKYRFVSNTEYFYQLSSTFSDYLKQSTRFYRGLRKQSDCFPEKFIMKNLSIPISAYLHGFFNSINMILTYPIHTIYYLISQIFMYTISYLYQPDINAWEISSSSKKL